MIRSLLNDFREIATAGVKVAARQGANALDQMVAERECRRSASTAGYEMRLRNPKRTLLGRGSTFDARVTLVGGEAESFFLRIGTDCVVRAGSYISGRRGCVDIGPYAYIGHNCWIGGQGRIEIGGWALIAPNVVIISSNHDFRRDDVPYGEQEEIAGLVTIGRNVWIGAGAVVLPDTAIGTGAVVAAGSVVARDVPERSLVAGVPAKVVRHLAGADTAEL